MSSRGDKIDLIIEVLTPMSYRVDVLEVDEMVRVKVGRHQFNYLLQVEGMVSHKYIGVGKFLIFNLNLYSFIEHLKPFDLEL